ncbi:MerR family transcriptional regulator [Adhaeribacter aquaticus]|uniref:MerR family transcriptional regulator n=1 Tax=Adhaeribacter aquaticus TaxID=299567 RepID=UPI000408905D|nr:MerR family transcriptional regulator [Adhaeribacter aquaticus]
MAEYSIKELEQLSGIKAHTIRIWEQRYGILNPKRTNTNIRYYDDADLKNILNISLLNGQGYKISRLAQMSDKQVAEEVMLLTSKTAPSSQQLNALLVSMIEMDEEKFDRVLTTAIVQRGVEKTMLDIVLPLLRKTGILWQTGNITPAQEHFISNIIRQKLFVAIDGQIPVNKGGTLRFLLYLPEGELHEIGLLFCNFILRNRGYHVMYLGQNLPFVDLTSAVQTYQPHFICTAFTIMAGQETMQDYINRLSQLAQNIIVYIGGGHLQTSPIVFPQNIVPISTLHQFVEQVASIER